MHVDLDRYRGAALGLPRGDWTYPNLDSGVIPSVIEAKRYPDHVGLSRKATPNSPLWP